ncbi:MAG TPA: NADH-quinone oxidoreductase subunit L, partial [Thermodesulfobacteriota bacterium]|nr:NADH-quinone oxidoreductase subunit L [Thermodesulfobacteriota bacterium]
AAAPGAHGAGAAASSPAAGLAVGVELGLLLASVLAALVGLVAAARLYLVEPAAAARLADRFPGLYRLLVNKYWVDELYDALVVRPFVRGSAWLWRRVDAGLIDGTVNGVGAALARGGAVLRLVQSGQAQSYAFYTLLGTVLVLGYFLVGR